TVAGAKVDVNGCELDSDGDGVRDSADNCPDTVPGATVDASGCELDSDHDGVLDSGDKCPNTPAGTPVNADGCEPDDDADGVANSADLCPGTPAGDEVSPFGCSLIRAIALEGVNFLSNDDTLTEASSVILDRVANVLIANGDLVVEIAGHTDAQGPDAYNLDLSQRRAASVRTYLIDKGVPKDRLSSKGYGETEPVADNRTAEGRAKNRRVELRPANQP
ncbi:MAG: OmpA family protein, partial [Gammaproteobacteria bacterium]|nr:OmpA family protein [Gammaproteobacteria bacterium]